jgi:hypothetical protein
MYRHSLHLPPPDTLLAQTYCTRIPSTRSAVIFTRKSDVVFHVLLGTPFLRFSITSNGIAMNESIKTGTKADLFKKSRGILFPPELKQIYFTQKDYFTHSQTTMAILDELLGSTLTRVGPTIDCVTETFSTWWGRETLPAHRFSH